VENTSRRTNDNASPECRGSATPKAANSSEMRIGNIGHSFPTHREVCVVFGHLPECVCGSALQAAQQLGHLDRPDGSFVALVVDSGSAAVASLLFGVDSEDA